MCGGIIRTSNPITMHHIEPRSKGGATSTENGSLVAHLEHSGLHILIDDDIKKLKLIKQFLYEYKATCDDKMRYEFYKWLERCLTEMEYQPTYTRDHLLTYHREDKKGRRRK